MLTLYFQGDEEDSLQGYLERAFKLHMIGVNTHRLNLLRYYSNLA